MCVHVCVHVSVYAYACVRAYVRAFVRVPMFSNDSCIGLGYNSGVSGTILVNIITHAHGIYGPCSYVCICACTCACIRACTRVQ